MLSSFLLYYLTNTSNIQIDYFCTINYYIFKTMCPLIETTLVYRFGTVKSTNILQLQQEFYLKKKFNELLNKVPRLLMGQLNPWLQSSTLINTKRDKTGSASKRKITVPLELSLLLWIYRNLIFTSGVLLNWILKSNSKPLDEYSLSQKVNVVIQNGIHHGHRIFGGQTGWAI